MTTMMLLLHSLATLRRRKPPGNSTLTKAYHNDGACHGSWVPKKLNAKKTEETKSELDSDVEKVWDESKGKKRTGKFLKYT